MRDYEGIFIFNPELSEDQTDKAVELTEEIIKQNKGEVKEIKKWGKRSLAYRVKKKKEGFYLLVDFQADTEVIVNLRRSYELRSEILKHLIFAC